MRAAGQLQADHVGILPRLWSNARRRPVRADLEIVGRQLLARAQTAGSVRPDLVYEDVAMLLWSIRGVVETTAAVAPDAWRRHLDLLLAAVAPSTCRWTTRRSATARWTRRSLGSGRSGAG